MKKFKITIVTLSLILFSCSKEDNGVAVLEPNIYISGYITSPTTGKTVPTYWKNGIATALTDGTKEASSDGIVVVNNDVYIVGSEENAYGIFNAKYWKNGVPTTVAANLNVNTFSNAIYVINNDVYVAGLEITTSNNSSAKYWKNGVAVTLSNGITQDEATGIYVQNNDVYVCGKVDNIATYWKNGVVTNLSDGTKNERARGLIVSNNDVYIFGIESTPQKPKYWKNGVQNVATTNPNLFCQTFGMDLLNNDVYLVGVEGLKAKYWKNGIATDLTDGTQFAIAQAIKTFNNDIYIAGYQNSSIKLWKNGVSSTIATDPFNQIGVTGIFLTN